MVADVFGLPCTMIEDPVSKTPLVIANDIEQPLEKRDEEPPLRCRHYIMNGP